MAIVVWRVSICPQELETCAFTFPERCAFTFPCVMSSCTLGKPANFMVLLWLFALHLQCIVCHGQTDGLTVTCLFIFLCFYQTLSMGVNGEIPYLFSQHAIYLIAGHSPSPRFKVFCQEKNRSHKRIKGLNTIFPIYICICLNSV